MEELARAIKSHIESDTLDVQSLNSLIRPEAFLVLRTQSSPDEEAGVGDPSAFTPINRFDDGSIDPIHHTPQLLLGRILPSPPCSNRASVDPSSRNQRVGTLGSSTAKSAQGPAVEQEPGEEQEQKDYNGPEQEQGQEGSLGHTADHTVAPGAGILLHRGEQTSHWEKEHDGKTGDTGFEAAYPSELVTNPLYPKRSKRKVVDYTETALRNGRRSSGVTPRGKRSRHSGLDDPSTSARGGESRTTQEIDNGGQERVSQVKPDDEVSARKQFIAHWNTRMGDFSDWQKLDSFAFIPGAKASSTPYDDLSRVMRWVSVIGAPNMHAVFGKNVQAWSSSPQSFQTKMELPSHLRQIRNINAAPIQKFWRAVEMSRNRRDFEGMATLLTRRAWVEMLSAYQEAVNEIRSDNKKKKIKLASGEKATTRAREMLYTMVYPDLEVREEAQKQFNKDQKRATAYYRLCTHYGHAGILALIPKMDDMAFRSTDGMHRAFLEVLDIVRPELHQNHMRLYAKIIDDIYGGSNPTPDDLARLEVLASAPRSEPSLGRD